MNEVVKNLIVHHDAIFSIDVPGPVYDKYSETILYADDGDDYFGGAISQPYDSENPRVWDPMVWSTHSGAKGLGINSSNTATLTSNISQVTSVGMHEPTRLQHRQSLLVSTEADSSPMDGKKSGKELGRRRSIDEEMFDHSEKRSNGRHELPGQKSFDMTQLAAQTTQLHSQLSPSSIISSPSNQSKSSNQQQRLVYGFWSE